VLILEHGVIAEHLDVDLPRPRTPEDPGFGALRRRLLTRLLAE
jgi:sulfonate transport system ATP-binding protein